ncbi:MAG: hypothetical protein ACRYHQ_31650 [Janthinobacterium lividum]
MQLISPLPPAECVRRLDAALALPTSDLRGRVGSGRVWLRRRIGYRNSFQPRLVARMRSGGVAGGTRLHVSVGMSPGIWVFLAVWMIVLAPLGFGVVLQTGQDLLHQGTSDMLPLALALSGFTVFPVLLTVAGTLLARTDREMLLRFVRMTVDAEIEPPPG